MYICKKGFTTKKGKHYGYTQQISNDEFDKLNEDQQSNFDHVDETDDENESEDKSERGESLG